MQEGTPIIIKKKKVHGHGHHGGAWKVAYADFVTAMMAFFLVMWILGMSDEEKESIAAYFNDPSGFSQRRPGHAIKIGPQGKEATPEQGEGARNEGIMEDKGELDDVQTQVEEAIEADPVLKNYADKGDIDVKQNDEGLVIELIENETTGEVFFEVGSSSVRDQARAIFAKIAPILAKSNRLLKVEGHTDARPYPGTGYDNFDLSSDRANAVRRLLLANGLKTDQVLSAEGRADTDPRNPADPFHFSNRRVTILLPYRYAKGSTYRLPAEIVDDEVEGVFTRPESGTTSAPTAPTLDLKGMYGIEGKE